MAYFDRVKNLVFSDGVENDPLARDFRSNGVLSFNNICSLS